MAAQPHLSTPGPVAATPTQSNASRHHILSFIHGAFEHPPSSGGLALALAVAVLQSLQPVSAIESHKTPSSKPAGHLHLEGGRQRRGIALSGLSEHVVNSKAGTTIAANTELFN